jgi:hypothetical protein
MKLNANRQVIRGILRSPNNLAEPLAVSRGQVHSTLVDFLPSSRETNRVALPRPGRNDQTVPVAIRYFFALIGGLTTSSIE